MNVIQQPRPPEIQAESSGVRTASGNHQTTARAARPRSALDRTSFSVEQVRRGLVLVLAFIALRASLTLVFDAQHIASAQDLRYVAYLVVAFVLGSIVLIYVGFTRWLQVDLIGWWIERRCARGDLAWGIAGAFAGAVLVGALAWAALTLGALAPPLAQSPRLPVEFLGSLFFGVAIAAFQEETLFRGFLQTALAQRFGARPALVLQALAFSAAHVGYFPLDAGYLYVSAFASGLMFGWLRLVRGRLVVPGLAHGLLG